MSLVVFWVALRRHPFSLGCTALLVVLSASLLGASSPLALLFWLAASLAILGAWHAIEPHALRALGCRAPNRLERERLVPLLTSHGDDAPPAEGRAGDRTPHGVATGAHAGGRQLDVLVMDTPQPWVGRGLGSLIISRAMLEVLEDRALTGLLSQMASPIWPANLVGELVVWLGGLPLLTAWLAARGLAQLGRPLALAVGWSLVLPLLLWPAGFARWGGRFFGSLLVGVVGATFLSTGCAAVGLGLLLSWVVVPGLQALLAWEWRRTERLADQATVEAGLGWQLLEALETLSWADALPGPDGVLGLLCQSGAPLGSRAENVWRAVARTSSSTS